MLRSQPLEPCRDAGSPLACSNAMTMRSESMPTLRGSQRGNGAGRLCVHSRDLLESTVRSLDETDTLLAASMTAPALGRGDAHHADRSAWSSPSSSQREQRQRIGSQAKVERQRRLDAQRAADQRSIRERVEQQKQLRDSRFHRMLESVGDGQVVHDIAVRLAETESQQDSRRRCLYKAWQEGVYNPMQNELFHKMNPPDRKALQQLTRSKSVAFSMPGDRAIVHASLVRNPTKKELVGHAEEEAFHRQASAVLQGHAKGNWSFADARYKGATVHTPDLAKSRPVLEPMQWGQLRVQALPCGRFAQVVESGPGVRMGRRGGPGSFLPDESDGVPTAGTRTVRVGPQTVAHGDLGVLRTDDPGHLLGESWRYRTAAGASSGAPLQDHYNLPHSSVTDREFPLGRRTFPAF